MTIDTGARLLIVDDESALMEALCNILAQQGYLTSGCTSAEDALKRLRTERFDLLLTDLMMPGTDGLALARAALEADPQMVMVMMTGQGSVATAVEAMQSGVLDYVLKPFKLGAMLPVLERALAIGRLRRDNLALQQRLLERTQELEVANLELEAYAATVSHDLRAPLHGIEGLAQLLAQRLAAHLTPEMQNLFTLLDSRVLRAQRLVDDLLRLSRVARQDLMRSDVDVSKMASEVALELRTGLTAPGMTVLVQDDMPHALADPALLRQVFVNLISNAIKFTHRLPRAQVEVGACVEGGAPGYFVRDNGPGFDMLLAERLFMPFERLQGAASYEGSGVGLSIVKRIVQRHGGRVRVEAALGQGATFYFTLGGGNTP
ncbi:response regulator [soil metagenome]